MAHSPPVSSVAHSAHLPSYSQNKCSRSQVVSSGAPFLVLLTALRYRLHLACWPEHSLALYHSLITSSSLPLGKQSPVLQNGISCPPFDVLGDLEFPVYPSAFFCFASSSTMGMNCQWPLSSPELSLCHSCTTNLGCK